MRYLACALALIALTAGTSAGQIREPAAAGAFYPSDPAELKSMIEGFLEKAEVKGVKGEPMALIAPHAGYIYSGAVAAYAFKAIEGRSFDDVIIIGPSHHASFPTSSRSTFGSTASRSSCPSSRRSSKGSSRSVSYTHLTLPTN